MTLEAALVVLLETSFLAAGLLALDRVAPASWIRHRHDASLAATLMVPVLLVIASAPAPPQPEMPARTLEIASGSGSSPTSNPVQPEARREFPAAPALLDAGADPNGFVLGDETPLVNAAQVGDLRMVKLLIARGADPSLAVPTGEKTPEKRMRSPYSEAVRRGHRHVVDYLESLGATR